MSHNKVYRNFIILQGDQESSQDKILSGYAKLEEKGDKCKISFYAQNLNKDEEYSVVLICYKKEMKQIVDLGSLNVKDEGKAEVCKEYHIKNIAGLEFSCDKVSGAGICKQKDEKLIFVMYGFINGEKVPKDWKKLKVVKQKDAYELVEKVEEPIKENEIIEEVTRKEEKEEANEKDNEEETDSNETDSNEKDSNVEQKNFQEESLEEYQMQHTSRNDDHQFEGTSNNFDEYEMKIENQKTIDPYNFKIKGSMGEFFENITSDFEEVRNKFKEIKYCKWYKVDVDDIDTLCDTSNYNRYVMIYYPMLNYYPYIRKYGYFFIGYKCDKDGELKYIVYGVPGTRDIEEQPYMGKTGFVSWMNTYDDKIGCWLMFYDYKTSTVVVPIN